MTVFELTLVFLSLRFGRCFALRYTDIASNIDNGWITISVRDYNNTFISLHENGQVRKSNQRLCTAHKCVVSTAVTTVSTKERCLVFGTCDRSYPTMELQSGMTEFWLKAEKHLKTAT